MHEIKILYDLCEVDIIQVFILLMINNLNGAQYIGNFYKCTRSKCYPSEPVNEIYRG